MTCTSNECWHARPTVVELERYRDALEEISEGVGCNSTYGPGCDTHCKAIARAALKDDA